MEKNQIAINFWARLDSCIGDTSLVKFCSCADISYNTVRNQRVREVLPSATDIIRISKALNVSIDFMLTGEEYEVSKEEKAVRINPVYRRIIMLALVDPEINRIIEGLAVRLSSSNARHTYSVSDLYPQKKLVDVAMS